MYHLGPVSKHHQTGRTRARAPTPRVIPTYTLPARCIASLCPARAASSRVTSRVVRRLYAQQTLRERAILTRRASVAIYSGQRLAQRAAAATAAPVALSYGRARRPGAPAGGRGVAGSRGRRKRTNKVEKSKRKYIGVRRRYCRGRPGHGGGAGRGRAWGRGASYLSCGPGAARAARPRNCSPARLRDTTRQGRLATALARLAPPSYARSSLVGAMTLNRLSERLASIST